MKISRDQPLILRGENAAWNWIERRLFASSRSDRSFYQQMFREDMLLHFLCDGQPGSDAVPG